MEHAGDLTYHDDCIMNRQYSLNYILTGFVLQKLNTVSSCIKHSRTRTRSHT